MWHLKCRVPTFIILVDIAIILMSMAIIIVVVFVGWSPELHFLLAIVITIILNAKMPIITTGITRVWVFGAFLKGFEI